LPLTGEDDRDFTDARMGIVQSMGEGSFVECTELIQG
jgi:hypothetical protein